MDDVTPAERVAASTPGGATDTVLRGDYPETSVGSGMPRTARSSGGTSAMHAGPASQAGSTNARGAPSGAAVADRWQDVAPTFRQAWGERHAPAGGSGARWEDAEPAYRYGWEASNDPRYHGRPYGDVEPELRREWGTRYPNAPWDVASEAIREAWERASRR